MESDVFGYQDDDAKDEQGSGVSGAPGCADPDGLPDVSLFADNVGDSYDVVGVGGVFESEKESESEDGYES